MELYGHEFHEYHELNRWRGDALAPRQSTKSSFREIRGLRVIRVQTAVALEPARHGFAIVIVAERTPNHRRDAATVPAHIQSPKIMSCAAAPTPIQIPDDPPPMPPTIPPNNPPTTCRRVSE